MRLGEPKGEVFDTDDDPEVGYGEGAAEGDGAIAVFAGVGEVMGGLYTRVGSG